MLLAPQAPVEKLGRTTGRTSGTVNSAIVQRWADGHPSIEIGVVGELHPFADLGDSGSLCLTPGPPGTDLSAGGLVVGKNNFINMALVTPMWAVLEDMTITMGAAVTIL
jgi:hypothetical protein